MSIGENIKNKRLLLNLTLEELANKIGTSKQTIQRYETGVIANIPSDKIESLAKKLNTTPSYLMGWEDTNDASSDKNNVNGSQKNMRSPTDERIEKMFSENPKLKEFFDIFRTLSSDEQERLLEIARCFQPKNHSNQ